MYLIVTLLALAKSAPVTRPTQDDVTSSILQKSLLDHNIETIGSCGNLQNVTSKLQQNFNTHIPKQEEIIHKENENPVSDETEDITRPTEDTERPSKNIERTTEDTERTTEDTERTTEDKERTTEDTERPKEDTERPNEKKGRLKEHRVRPNEETKRLIEDKERPTKDTERPIEVKDKPVKDIAKTKVDTEKPIENTDRTMEVRAGRTEDTERTMEDRARCMDDVHRTIEDRDERMDDVNRTMEDRDGRTEDIERTMEDRAGRTEDTDRTMEDRAGRTEDIERTMEDRAGRTEDTDRTMEDRAGRKDNTTRRIKGTPGQGKAGQGKAEITNGPQGMTENKKWNSTFIDDVLRLIGPKNALIVTSDVYCTYDYLCWMYGDCCPDFYSNKFSINQNVSSFLEATVKRFEYVDVVDELVDAFYDIHMTQLSTCVSDDTQIRERMVTKCSGAEFIRSKFDFGFRKIKEDILYGASVFVSLTKEDIVHRCEKPQRVPFDHLQHIPLSRHNFYNIFCAVCNGFDIRNVLQWRTAMKCNIGRNASINKRFMDKDIFLSNKSFSEYITLNSCKSHLLHHYTSRICFETSDSFPEVSNKHATINNSRDLTKKLEEIWYAMCQKYTFVVAETTTGNLYKNPHCLIIANSDKFMTSPQSGDAKSLFEMVLACSKNTCPWSSNKVNYKNSSYHSVNLNLFHFFDHSKTAPDQMTSCPEQHVFVVFYNTCVVPRCPEDMQFINGKCTEPIPEMCNFTGDSIVCPRLNKTEKQQLEYKLSYLPLIRAEHQIKLSFAFMNVFYEESMPRMFSIPLLESSAFCFGDTVYDNKTSSLDKINLSAVWKKILSKSNEMERRQNLVTQLMGKTVFFAKPNAKKITVIVNMGHRLCSNNSQVNRHWNHTWPLFEFIESDQEISYVCEDLKTIKNFSNGNITRLNSCHLMKREAMEKPDFVIDTCITITFEQGISEAFFYQWLEYLLNKIFENLSTVYFNGIIKCAFLSNKEQYVEGKNPFPGSDTYDELQEMDMTSHDRGCPEGQKIVVNEWSVVSINRSLYAIDDQLVRFPTGPFWYDLLLNNENIFHPAKLDKAIVAWCVQNTAVTNRFLVSSLLVIQMKLVAFV